MATYANIQDVEAVWRPLSDAELGMVETQLDYAAMLIRQAAPTVDEWVAGGVLDEGVLRYVSVQMVRNFLLNPEGRKSGSRTIDDYTETWALSDAIAAGGMSVTADLLALLRPVGSGRSDGAFTIHPGARPGRYFDARDR